MAWHSLLILMLPLRFLGFNPLTASDDDRLVDILDETANFDIVSLVGTGHRFSEGVQQYKRCNFDVFSCGYGRSPLTNKSCGVAICLGHRFKSSRIRQPVYASGRIAGRALAVRVSNKVLDVMCIAMYFPPTPWKRSQYPAYLETVRLMCVWLGELLNSLPGGVMPAFFMDLNDGIGKQAFGTSTIDVPTACISQPATRLERIKNGAGEGVRTLMDLHGMASLSSWNDARPTLFGSNGNESLIDHWFFPAALLDAVFTAGPLMGMAKRLQLIRRPCAADHVPVHVGIWYLRRHLNVNETLSPQFQVAPELCDIQWDLERLMLAVREGD